VEQAEAIAGAILGCAVGDALGLPYEGLSKRRGVRLLGPPDRMRLIAGRGMVSDDTEHTCMVAQALCLNPNDPDGFARQLGWRLRWWLLGMPAGIGLATLRSILKLWLGWPPSRSGVFSAGNGPAMRSPILGAAIDDIEMLRAFVRASTRITHSDPKANHGAFAVALAAWCAKRGIDTPDAFFAKYRASAGAEIDPEFDALMVRVAASLAAGDSTEIFAEKMGCGQRVSGYVYHTVPVVLHSWLSHPRDIRLAVMAVIRCGGDTDTTAAIVGAIVGAGAGSEGIPREWLSRLLEWPRSVHWMSRLAHAVRSAVSSAVRQAPPRCYPLVGLARNIFFLIIVLGHVARRMLPPY
jgi:ADP-ribosyl-[dinitrogen reductase] hydrolase